MDYMGHQEWESLCLREVTFIAQFSALCHYDKYPFFAILKVAEKPNY